MHKILLIDHICQETNEEEDFPALTHRYKDLKIAYASVEEDWFQPTERNNTDNTWTRA